MIDAPQDPRTSKFLSRLLGPDAGRGGPKHEPPPKPVIPGHGVYGHIEQREHGAGGL